VCFVGRSPHPPGGAFAPRTPPFLVAFLWGCHLLGGVALIFLCGFASSLVSSRHFSWGWPLCVGVEVWGEFDGSGRGVGEPGGVRQGCRPSVAMRGRCTSGGVRQRLPAEPEDVLQRCGSAGEFGQGCRAR